MGVEARMVKTDGKKLDCKSIPDYSETVLVYWKSVDFSSQDALFKELSDASFMTCTS
jgi:hypothetical protein